MFNRPRVTPETIFTEYISDQYKKYEEKKLREFAKEKTQAIFINLFSDRKRAKDVSNDQIKLHIKQWLANEIEENWICDQIVSEAKRRVISGCNISEFDISEVELVQYFIEAIEDISEGRNKDVHITYINLF